MSLCCCFINKNLPSLLLFLLLGDWRVNLLPTSFVLSEHLGGVTTPARYETNILKTVFTGASPPRIGTLSAPQPFFCEKYPFFLPPAVCQLSASCLPVVLPKQRAGPECWFKTIKRNRRSSQNMKYWRSFFLFVCRHAIVCQLCASCFAKTTGRPRVLVQNNQAKQKKFPEYEILKNKFLEK